MVVVITYRILKALRHITRNRVLLLLIFFIATWSISTVLFYWSEHVKAGRSDIDIWTSMYWALITMATVGYGDVVPSRGPGWAVAGLTAVFGIAVYTLFISTIADRFLEATVKASMGLGRLHDKEIIVIGEGPVCQEAVKELVANKLAKKTGWIKEELPKGDPGVDYIVGQLDEDTFRRAGVDRAGKIIVCYEDDSKSIYAVALARKINRNAKITVLARGEDTIHILEMLGADTIIPMSIIGRLLASGSFEPSVVKFMSDVTSARGGLDIKEHRASREASVQQFEEMLEGRVVALEREGRLLLPREGETVRPGDKIIYVSKVEEERTCKRSR